MITRDYHSSHYFLDSEIKLQVTMDFHGAVALCKEDGSRLCRPDELPNVGDCSDVSSSEFVWTCSAGDISCTSNAECCGGICGANNLCWRWAAGRYDWFEVIGTNLGWPLPGYCSACSLNMSEKKSLIGYFTK